MALSPFFICGKCGFKNHPRLNQDNQKCEQCGTSSSDPVHPALEYNPAD